MTAHTPTIEYPDAGCSSFWYEPLAPSGSGPRRSDGEDLVRLDGARERSFEEAVERHDPLAPLGAEHDRVVERQAQGRQVRGRVGVRDGATDRAPVADLDVADPGDAVPREVERGRLERLGVRRQRAELEAAVRGRADALQLRQPADVDESLWLCEPELHERQEAHAAGQDLGLAVGDRRQRIVEGRRPLVLECRRDHAWPPFADWIADHTLAEV